MFYGEMNKTHITQVSQNRKPICSFSVVVSSDYEDSSLKMFLYKGLIPP